MKFLFVFFLWPFSLIFSEIHHNYLNKQDNVITNSYCWTKENVSPFKELLISWNSLRPKKGHYSIYVRVKTDNWSKWLLYAQWGNNFQKGFISTQKNVNIPLRVYQDAVEILEKNFGNSFKIKIIGENGADISNLKSIHVCTSNLNSISSDIILNTNKSYFLDVKGLSQMALIDERKNRLCSPTSTTTVIKFLKNDNSLNPIEFAENVWDVSFDIFGNWVFNVAEAYNQINNPSYSCWIERLDSFQNILNFLEEGLPVVISIRSPLPGSAKFYKSGHLIVVIDFDSSSNEVICMDPAFDKDEETIVRYKLDDLIKAWKKRKNISYIFKNLENMTNIF